MGSPVPVSYRKTGLRQFPHRNDVIFISNHLIMKEQVLQAMREFGAPVNAGKIAEMTGIDRKEVDKAFAELKREGAIVSPVRCKWAPAQ